MSTKCKQKNAYQVRNSSQYNKLMNKPDLQQRSFSDEIGGYWRRFFQWPAATTLALAALLKAHQLATSPYTKNLVFESRSMTTILIVAEVLLAFWLVSNWKSFASRIVAIVAFGCFSIATAFRIAAGDASCGCFGVIEIPPKITFVADLLLLFLLGFWEPPNRKERPGIGLLLGAVVSIAILLTPVFNFSTSSLSDIGQVVGDSTPVVVDSAKWIGKRLPLENYIEGNQSYLEGSWEMVLYHEDCPVCQRLMVAAIEDENSSKRQVFVEVPPYKSPTRESRENLLWCKLSNTHDWFVGAPDVIELRDGFVEASHGQQH